VSQTLTVQSSDAQASRLQFLLQHTVKTQLGDSHMCVYAEPETRLRLQIIQRVTTKTAIVFFEKLPKNTVLASFRDNLGLDLTSSVTNAC
jgi:hypothetical protein